MRLNDWRSPLRLCRPPLSQRSETDRERILRSFLRDKTASHELFQHRVGVDDVVAADALVTA